MGYNTTIDTHALLQRAYDLLDGIETRGLLEPGSPDNAKDVHVVEEFHELLYELAKYYKRA